MLFLLRCLDQPDALPLRQAVRPEHLAYLAEYADQIRFAGPLLSDGDTPSARGSVLILDMADKAEVERFAAGDPYAKAGVFAEVTVTATRASAGTWVDS